MPTPSTPRDVPPSLPVLHPGVGDLVPVSRLFENLGLRRPHPSSIWRICARGNARAGRLPALRVLGAWHSTEEAGAIRLLTVPPYLARSASELLLPHEVVQRDSQ